MRRHVSAVESTVQGIRNRAHQLHLSPSISPRNGAHAFNRGTFTPKLITARAVCMLGCIAILFLIGVHIFLAQVLLSNEPRLLKEFSFPGDPPNNAVVGTTMEDGVAQRTQRLLTPLRSPLDYELYTIRINSWKRVELLETSIRHHASCPGVAQIQVVWCDEQGEPPVTLMEEPKVVLERHAINSLNERFHILRETEPPTMGILSMDDDVLRPCEAIDAGFFKWTQNPERMVGFDGRGHVVVKQSSLDENGRPKDQDGSAEWAYAYLSETERTNHYSITLPRYSFLHRDYLRWYMTDLPKPILTAVAEKFNCEDIAMSFFVSSQTDGQPPLLADKWASRGSQIKLYSHYGGISNTKNHKKLRDACVDTFANLLDLKDRLQYGRFMGTGFFNCGVEGRVTNGVVHSERQRQYEAMNNSWKTMPDEKVIEAMIKMKEHAAHSAFQNGLMENTEPWEKRWDLKSKKRNH